jgi:hypothetical protein
VDLVERIVDRGIEYGVMKETTDGSRAWLTIMVLCLRETTKETSESKAWRRAT